MKLDKRAHRVPSQAANVARRVAAAVRYVDGREVALPRCSQRNRPKNGVTTRIRRCDILAVLGVEK